MTYLLDTNVVSELRKLGDGKADANVVAFVGRKDAASFFLSAITVLEPERGILGVQRRDVHQGARLRTWLDKYPRPANSDLRLPVESYPSKIPAPRAGRIFISLTGVTKSIR